MKCNVPPGYIYESIKNAWRDADILNKYNPGGMFCVYELETHEATMRIKK